MKRVNKSIKNDYAYMVDLATIKILTDLTGVHISGAYNDAFINYLKEKGKEEYADELLKILAKHMDRFSKGFSKDLEKATIKMADDELKEGANLSYQDFDA